MEVDGVVRLLEVPGDVVPPERQEGVHVHVEPAIRPGGVEGDAALVLVDAVGGLRDADLVEVRAEEIHGRGPRRATAGAGAGRV